jgi:general secretion pathway protein A
VNIKQLQAYYGLKWNPFLPEVPADALVKDESTKRLCWRVEHVVMDGGFAMVTGEPGSGKSIALRQLQAHLSELPELTVRVLARPQSHIRDFYREMGDVFGVELKTGNRFGNFSALRSQWLSHIKSSMFRPVLLLDEAQETPDEVLSELRLLSSINLDSKNILAVVLAGDSRLPGKLRSTALLPLESRIRVRHHLDKRPPEEMAHILTELLAHAGAETLLTPGLIKTMAEHAMGNLRAMMMLGTELLAAGAQRQVRQLDEDLFFEVFRDALKKRKGTR